MSKIFWILWGALGILLSGCSGGSVGADNPQLALTWQPLDDRPVDTLRVAFWGVEQDVRLNPRPIWDTVVVGVSKIRLNTEGLCLPDEWTVQAVTEDGRVGVIRASLADSLVRVPLVPTTGIVLLDTARVFPWIARANDPQPATGSDTLKIAPIGYDSGTVLYLAEPLREVSSVRYVQVLGTAIVAEVFSDITLYLDMSRYVLLYLDENGRELIRREVVVP